MGSHSLQCEAPICLGDTNSEWKTTVIWLPGEEVCRLKSTKISQNQRKINKLVTQGVFKNMDAYFTAHNLEKIDRITSSTRGCGGRYFKKKTILAYREAVVHPKHELRYA